MTALPRTTLFGHDVPPISVGCAHLASNPDAFGYAVSEELAHATVRAALESELNWIDTAAKYGHGESERRVGHVLKEMGGLPASAFLETKIGVSQDDRFDGASTRELFARSQDLLGIEEFELVFLHDPESRSWDAITGRDGALNALLELREAGKIKHLGLAGGTVDVMKRYVETGHFEAVITHNRYTLMNRSADSLIQLAHDRGLPVLNAAPYGSGILAKGPDHYPRYAYNVVEGETLDRARTLEEICACYEIPLAAAALQFSLRDPRITGTIVGMTRPERIEQTLAFATTPIPDACWEELLAVPFDTEDL